jgi:AraC family transcriptional regulator
MTRRQPFAGKALHARELTAYSLAETIYPAHLQMPRHEHEEAYLSLLLEGGYDERCGQQARSCQPASLVFHPPGEDHAVAFHQRPVRIFRVQIKQPFLLQVREYSTIFEHGAAFAGGPLSHLATRLYREARATDKAATLAIEGLLLELIATASRQQAVGASSCLPNWLSRARDLLHEQLSEGVTVSDIAETVGVHPVYLARVFRKHFHCSVGDYVRKLRVEHAAHQMAESDSPLAEIAQAAGFYDQSHFTRTFKQITGLTPTEFRATLQ